MDYKRVEQALRGLLAAGDLGDAEQDEYLDGLTQTMSQLSATEVKFWNERERRGLGVGIDDDGKLVQGAKRR